MPRQELFLIGTMKNQITGSKLPSKRDCLSVLFYNMRFVKLNLNESSHLVIDECMVFWRKPRIPTQYSSDYATKLKKLYENWRSLDKNKSRKTDTQAKRNKIFVEELDDIFDIAHANALNTIKIEEDKQFLLKQRQKGRPGCMLGIDMRLTGVQNRKICRQEEEEKRKIIQQKETGNF